MFAAANDGVATSKQKVIANPVTTRFINSPSVSFGAPVLGLSFFAQIGFVWCQMHKPLVLMDRCRRAVARLGASTPSGDGSIRRPSVVLCW
ncbi:hypothetical protein ACCT30_32905, partial [Rhizobium ruizarguesonis]